MRPAARQEIRYVNDRCVRGRHSDPEIVIQNVVKIGTEPRAAANPDVATEEDLRLIEKAGGKPKAIHLKQQAQRQRHRWAKWQSRVVVSKHVAAMKPDLPAASHHHIDLVCFECLRHPKQGTWLEQVVTIEPGQYLPSGALEALVQSIRLTFVALDQQIGESRSILFQEIDTSVRRLRVDDNEFQVGILLIENRPDPLFEERNLIEAYHHHRNLRP